MGKNAEKGEYEKKKVSRSYCVRTQAQNVPSSIKPVMVKILRTIRASKM